MILTYKCGNCKKVFTLPFKVNDRGELNRHKPSIVEKCPHCNFKNKIIINDVKAKISPYVNFIYGYAFLISIIIGVLMYLFLDFTFKNTNSNWQYYVFTLIFLIPFLIAKIIFENDLKSVKIFNRYYV